MLLNSLGVMACRSEELNEVNAVVVSPAAWAVTKEAICTVEKLEITTGNCVGVKAATCVGVKLLICVGVKPDSWVVVSAEIT